MSRKYTQSQQNVIDTRGKNILVSASAGTGKTTVMIERIALLIKEGLDVDQIVVVTFTNLAAAEMKNRLAKKLMEYSQDIHVREQLEKLDNASICTIHSFCSDLLRNYFYVVDIDPAFGILDNVTVNALLQSALDELFVGYFAQKDDAFKKLYKIFATNRREENFKSIILDLYNFSRNIVDFGEWYQQNRNYFVTHDENSPVVQTLLKDIAQTLNFCKANLRDIATRCQAEGAVEIEQVCQHNAHLLDKVNLESLQNAINGICALQLESLPRKGKKNLSEVDWDIEKQIRDDCKEIEGILKKLVETYSDLTRGNTIEHMWKEMDFSVEICDKLVEMVINFSEIFYQLKKQRGGVDFGDLEHLALKVLQDEPTANAIKQKYKMVFVDEYQDTNPVQEAIVSALSLPNGLFMVGDVKQSIYGFRGCEPNIFIGKYYEYKTGNGGIVEELNDNFRSNNQILRFVNVVFSKIMTERFGKVDYKNTSQFVGVTDPLLPLPSVSVDLILKEEKESIEATDLYDITIPTVEGDSNNQGNLIAHRIKQMVGKAYKDKDGNSKRIQYGDIVILMRNLTGKAVDIYNTLIEKNIPVTANFKVDGYASKEVRELINLLHVLDNPYNDVYLVGVCLGYFGKFTETELAKIRLDTTGRVPFFDRLCEYLSRFDDTVSKKTQHLLEFLDNLRFYSRGASVCDVVIQAIKLTNFHLHVESLPNGALRLRKMYNFVDSLKDATYAQSVSKFLSFMDETTDSRTQEAISATNAVRLMTMHASKGLEFPVVILAGLEGQFIFDNRVVDRNADLGLATKYYDFEHMKKYSTLGSIACALVNKTKQREEEMRLFYVAMTRAKHSLCLVGTIPQKQLTGLPKQPTKAMSFMDWLMYALKKSYPTLQSADQSLTITVMDSIDEVSLASQDTLCEQYTDEKAVLSKLQYSYPYLNQTKMPSKIVSSALDKQFFDDEELNPVPVIVQDDKNKVGSAYHTVYQFVDYNANLAEIQQTIQGLVNEGKIESQYADQVDPAKIFATLQNPQLRQIMSQGKTYHEIPFMIYAPYDTLAKDKRYHDDVMLQGVIDLLVIAENKATVVDFKYTSRSDNLDKRYHYQLNSYKLAVQQICGIADVDAYILSIEDNKLVKM